MGLEAVCRCTIDGVRAEKKALLEATELILRAPFRRSFQIADLTSVEAIGNELRANFGGLAVMLELGDEIAAKWAKRIAALPAPLSRKLGIGHASPVFVIGDVDEPLLVGAIDGHTADPVTAKSSLSVVQDAQQLDSAVMIHQATMGRAPIWIIHGKCRSAKFSGTAVRQYMRAQGHRDTKVSGISGTLSATRYTLP